MNRDEALRQEECLHQNFSSSSNSAMSYIGVTQGQTGKKILAPKLRTALQSLYFSTGGNWMLFPRDLEQKIRLSPQQGYWIDPLKYIIQTVKSILSQSRDEKGLPKAKRHLLRTSVRACLRLSLLLVLIPAGFALRQKSDSLPIYKSESERSNFRAISRVGPFTAAQPRISLFLSEKKELTRLVRKLDQESCAQQSDAMSRSKRSREAGHRTPI